MSGSLSNDDAVYETASGTVGDLTRSDPDGGQLDLSDSDMIGLLDQVADRLHRSHKLSSEPAKRIPAWQDIAKAEDWLNDARAKCVNAPSEAAKAAEWLLDNDYQVFRAIRQINEDLPASFYRQLPALETDGQAGFPRVYALAHHLIQATHLQITLSGTVRFINAYQRRHSLSIAELWAFPTMLRIACLDILVNSLSVIFDERISRPFALSDAAKVEYSLDETECVARSIANLSLIGSISWEDFFDRTSLVERALADDPSGFYPKMDFETRDRYRRAVEKIASYCDKDELSIANEAVKQSKLAGEGSAEFHVGYWLIGLGRSQFEKHLGGRPPRGLRLRRWAFDHAGTIYATSLILFLLGALTVPTVYLLLINANALAFAGSILIMLIPASVLAISLVQRLATLIVPPKNLPKLDFTDGLPTQYPVIVAIPALVATLDEVQGLVEQVEAHWLANSDENLQVALLADLADAPDEVCEGDQQIIDQLVEEFRRLNRKHDSRGRGRFHLLLRPRQYNKCEGCWMAWERKRGKLEQFNRLLIDGDDSGFSVHEGNRKSLQNIRFVVTLDVDTVLPTGSVAKLAGTLAHPQNLARFDQKSGRIVSGYSILQPRVEMAPQSVSRTFFTRFFAGDTAIDIYSRAVSNVYQDLFGSGIFVGKGIYDVAAFHRSVDGCIPQDTILSHDLLEGSLGRAGLASDIVLYEGFPDTYLEYVKRWHRWVRGDWQLLPWLGRRMPTSEGESARNRLSGLDRWKIVDNLRRSLISPSLLLMVTIGWLFLPGNPWFWTFLAVFAHGGQLFTDLITGLARGRRRGAVRGLFAQLADQSGRWFLAIAYLPFESFVAVHAIVIALWRQFISRRHMLQWTSAAHESKRQSSRTSRVAIWTDMWVGPTSAAVLGLAIYHINPASLPAAIPILLLWFIAPEITVRLSRSRHRPARPLDETDRLFLREIARRTWLYFETFAGPQDNWLPPDNYQGEPYPEIAHRTSPTNIGMMLLSSVSAWDLGYLGAEELTARTSNSFDTLDRLEMHRGHWLNWYDTLSLQPLEPRYVSVVDSGNLVGCFIALISFLREIEMAPPIEPQRWTGVDDVLRLLAAVADRVESGRKPLRLALESLGKGLHGLMENPLCWYRKLDQICQNDIPEIEREIGQLAASSELISTENLRELHAWFDRLKHQLLAIQQDIEKFAPWLTLDSAPPSLEHVESDVAALLAAGSGEERFAQALAMLSAQTSNEELEQRWIKSCQNAVMSGQKQRKALVKKVRKLSERTQVYNDNMQFAPFYDRDRRLFNIGYNASADKLDSHHYDLLASEARLASYIAIAHGQVPLEHWFHLGRPVMRHGRGLALISWNGSMFEYLMPRLLMRSGPETLLYESEKVAVQAQRAYGRKSGTPWGISESAYAARDPEHRYQYQAFGVPGLGLRRGLAKDIVVAPYASALALHVQPAEAAANMRDIVDAGLSGLYGLFEAADFTEERLERGQQVNPVHAYMAHHQGMILCAIGNSLCDDRLVKRFEEDPRIRAVSLLLHERVPQELPSEVERLESVDLARRTLGSGQRPQVWLPPLDTDSPQAQLLGNGSFSSSISTSGGGGLRWRHHALTRFLPDSTRDGDGLWIYLHDTETGDIWSATRQPTEKKPDQYEVTYQSHLAEFHRRDHDVSVGMEVCVAAGDDLEIRRLSITNLGNRTRSFRLTSYGEPVLAPALDDERHPAFSKLFIGSEYVPHLGGLLLSRRPRKPGDSPPVLLHFALCEDGSAPRWRYESDRRKFIGRNGSLKSPRGAMEELSNSSGWTIDPIMALQLDCEFAPYERKEICLLTIAAATKEGALEIAERYATLPSIDWAIGDAASAAVHETERLKISAGQMAEIQSLGSLLAYPFGKLRGAADKIRNNRLGQPSLWGMAISGDLPILLYKADQGADTLLPLLIRAHQLWRRQGLEVDLVIMQSAASGYIQPVRDDLVDLLQEIDAQWMLGRNGGIHLLFLDQVGADQSRLIEALARAVIDDRHGPLKDQMDQAFQPVQALPHFEPARSAVENDHVPELVRPTNLIWDNGVGGFTPDGREYCIYLAAGQSTPAPWVNILANDGFGSVVTEAGGGFSWAVNSGENRITPWTNDPVTDEPSESLYLRDEETAEVWTPTPGPNGREASCQIDHGTGYSRWQKMSHGLEQDLRIFVPLDDPVKIIRLRLTNHSKRHRRVTATYYVDWLLGALRSVSRDSVVCHFDARQDAVFARNSWNPDFSGKLAFLTADCPPHGITTDRKEFIGREGSLENPAGLERWGLDRTDRPGCDPCAAYQVHLDLGPGETETVTFILGQGDNESHAASLVAEWKDPSRLESAFDALIKKWDDLLGAIEIKTDDPGFDIMTNRWLLYQSMSSRLLARAGFYQASGAIGFRDQLQDVLAFLHNDPARARAHILECAAHQFEEGDVLHWWHPPSDRGVRTRCSDDLIWLPYATCQYVEVTGDESILQEKIPFLRAPPLSADEEDRYSAFEQTSTRHSLYDHCHKALERGFTQGANGLPLMGAGDWNDGMDRVGHKGRGESIWLGWFAIVTADGFAALSRKTGKKRIAENWAKRAVDMREAIERSGWDGGWYRRAYDDDGQPWGSSENVECRIDSISQSWAVFAGADEKRTCAAREAAWRELVDQENRITRLLWPAFDKTPRDPGYIKAYPPGIRENGGQYSHAAAWLGIALARSGEPDKAMDVFKMLSPVGRVSDPQQAENYLVEPYAVAADIAGGEVHGGRGGWTWYTGAAAWTWRLAVEEILGLKLKNGHLEINPAIPTYWKGFSATIRQPGGSISVRVRRVAKDLGSPEYYVDGELQKTGAIAFPQDGIERKVEILL